MKEELTPEESAVILQALQSWLRKTAADIFDTVRRDPATGSALLDTALAPIERLIEKFQV